MIFRRYTDLVQLEMFEERFEYLSLQGEVGRETFGSDRYLNQAFYTSSEWRQIRNEVIVRDNGCDLGISGYEIHTRLYIHHMNPITADDLLQGNLNVLDPEYLIVVSHRTHNAIHYGDVSKLSRPPVVRRQGDTKLW